MRKEVEQLRPMRDDLDILRSDNKRYLEKVIYFGFIFRLTSLTNLFFQIRDLEKQQVCLPLEECSLYSPITLVEFGSPV